MKEMIQKNKGRLICSAFVMCMGMILGYTCENSLWVNGTFAVTYVIAIAVTFYDNRNRQQSDKVIRMVTWIVPGMTLLYNGIARWIDMGVRKEYLLMAILYVGMGLLFVIVGNYLPKVKPEPLINSSTSYGHCRMRRTGMPRTASVEKYGWQQDCGVARELHGLFGDSMAACFVCCPLSRQQARQHPVFLYLL